MKSFIGFTLSVVLATPLYADVEVEGTYLVPAGNHMAEAVTVELTRARFSIGEDGVAKVDYRLPEVLGGKDAPRIVVEGPMEGNGPWYLSGEEATAVCSRGEDLKYSCTMFYALNGSLDDGTPVFDLDIEAAAAYIDAQKDLTPERKSALKRAGVSLMYEAIGVVSFLD